MDSMLQAWNLTFQTGETNFQMLWSMELLCILKKIHKLMALLLYLPSAPTLIFHCYINCYYKHPIHIIQNTYECYKYDCRCVSNQSNNTVLDFENYRWWIPTDYIYWREVVLLSRCIGKITACFTWILSRKTSSLKWNSRKAVLYINI